MSLTLRDVTYRQSSQTKTDFTDTDGRFSAPGHSSPTRVGSPSLSAQPAALQGTDKHVVPLLDQADKHELKKRRSIPTFH
jgi:hypothetical protein